MQERIPLDILCKIMIELKYKERARFALTENGLYTTFFPIFF
jgi:hypothetical protein